jgi:cytochrome b561
MEVLIFSLFLLVIAGLMIWAIWFRKPSAATFATRLLHFAAGLLVGLSLVFALSMVMYYWSPSESEAGAKIFDACTKVIPPIMALVVGYYFGASKEKE